MLNIDTAQRFLTSFEATGAQHKELQARQKTTANIWQIIPEIDLEQLIAEAVATDLGTGKLEARLAAIARDYIEHNALTHVRDVARIHADAALAAYISENLDELFEAMSKAVQPRIDEALSIARTLPKYIRNDGTFAVDKSWTPEQFAAWAKLEPQLTELDRLRDSLAPLFAGIGGDARPSWMPNTWLPWFAWFAPGDKAGSLSNLDGKRNVSGQFNLASQSFNVWVAMAHNPDLTWELAGPARAEERLRAFIAQRLATRPRATEDRSRSEVGMYIGRVLRG